MSNEEKVKRLVEQVARMIVGEPSKIEHKGKWIDDPLHEMDVENAKEQAKQILSRPGLALKYYEEWGGFKYIPLAEAIKEIEDA